jgi:hypothetical protein
MCARLMPMRLRSIFEIVQLPFPDACVTVLARLGNAISQGASQMREVNPRMKNAFFQPNETTSAAINGAPNARPARVPQFTRPEARPRSFGEKHADDLHAAGQVDGFADAQQDAQDNHHTEAGREACEAARQRPQRKQPA